MKFNFRFFASLLGVLLLGTVAFAAHKRTGSAVDARPYQASVIDALVPSETQVVVEESVQRDAPAELAVASDPVLVTQVDSDAAAALVAAVEQSLSFSPVTVETSPVFVAAPAPILTTVVGFGGTLANRASASTIIADEPVVVAPSVVDSPVPEPSVSITPFVCTSDWDDTVGSDTGQVVINELFIDMGGGDTKEFIELYNPTGVAVHLASSSLQYLSGSAAGITSITKKDFPAGASVEAHGFYLIGMGGYTGEPVADMTWSQSLSNTGATVLLVRNKTAVTGATDEDIADRIAYGSGTFLLDGGLPAPLPPVEQSIGRGIDGFTVQATPSPRVINPIIAL